jgi:hypothetical protein
LWSPAPRIAEEPVQQYQRRTLPNVSVGHGMSVHLGVSQLSDSHVSMMPPYEAQREVVEHPFHALGLIRT